MHAFVSNKALAWLTAAAYGCLIVGCGPQGVARYDVEGTVTFDGKPLPRGTIRFEADATKGNSGPVGIAAIVDGSYSTAGDGSRGALRGPIVAVIMGLPAAKPDVEYQRPLFEDYRIEATLEPTGRSSTRLDFSVPKQTAR
ncbi:MAG: hypothetical protein EBZ74_09630 [Planctomycetia bacterium]|nr:hypothetical protein [Planctomycetia bacterium]